MQSPLLLGDASSLTSSWRSCPGTLGGSFLWCRPSATVRVTAVLVYLGDEQGFGFWGLGSVAHLEASGTSRAHGHAQPRQHGEEEQPASTCPQPWLIPGGAGNLQRHQNPTDCFPFLHRWHRDNSIHLLEVCKNQENVLPVHHHSRFVLSLWVFLAKKGSAWGARDPLTGCAPGMPTGLQLQTFRFCLTRE